MADKVKVAVPKVSIHDDLEMLKARLHELAARCDATADRLGPEGDPLTPDDRQLIAFSMLEDLQERLSMVEFWFMKANPDRAEDAMYEVKRLITTRF